ncbi:MAG: acyl-CoA reductase [Bacteroidetes bacterium]|nr:acyl-CoA reductase [Bacteroidota bacterium]
MMEDSLVEVLINKPPYNFSKQEKDIDFYNALLEELNFHYTNNKLFKHFCDNKNFNPQNFVGNLSEIPYISVNVFKELGEDLISVPNEDIKFNLQSSATSGIPSTILVDKITSKRQSKVMIKVVQEFIGKDRKPFLVMDINPQSEYRNLLGARYAAISGYLNFANEISYFLKVDEKNKYFFDIKGIREYISKLTASQPAIIFGFTYILFSEVIRPYLEKGEMFQLPVGSKIIHIGGWKKLENEKVTKEEFNKNASVLFGINPDDVIDIYGFTEQMGLNYPDCLCGFKHASLYSEVIIRDTVTKEVLPEGNEGMLEFLSPIPHSYPGNVVLTDDIGIIDKNPCPYGKQGTRFKIIGRLKKAEIRGCGDILSSKLKFLDSKIISINDEVQLFKVEFWKGEDVSNLKSNEEQLTSIIDQLNQSVKWLRSQPIDALIGLIGKIALKWMDFEKSENEILKDKGLSFLSAWCSPEHLVRISTIGLRGNRKYMNSFLPMEDSTIQYMKATSRGLVCHWLAGNVQVLGMFALVQSILTKNVNLLKISSKDDGIFSLMLSAFENVSFTTKGGYTIKADDLLKTIGVIYYDHNESKLGEIMSKAAKARIAWGGRDAVQTVSTYPAAYDCEDLILGPKLSFSVIAKEKLEDERKVKKLARKIAVDASVFDQTGCASPHNLFIERGGNISPKEFSVLLAEGMKKTTLQIPKGSISPEQISAIHSIRSLYDFKGIAWTSTDSTWTVLYSEDMNLNQPVYSRVLFVHPVNHIDETLIFINDNIQTIGLAATGKKAISYADKATAKGAMRLPDLGKMLNFESPWDGLFIMDRLVRWNTMGGPLV